MPTAKIDTASSGNTTIVAADNAGRRVVVTAFAFVCGGTVSVKFRSGASTDLTGAMPFVANGGMSSPSAGGDTAGYSVLETAAGESLVINLSGAVQVSGWVSYDLRR